MCVKCGKESESYKVAAALAAFSENSAKAEANLLLLPVKFQTEVIATITGNGVCFQIQ